MLYATSGLRRDEVLNLNMSDVDFNQHLIRPQPNNGSRTKRIWVTFYNAECEQVLTAYLKERRDCNPKLIPIGSRNYRGIWCNGITPQILRDGFAEEMTKLGVAERYVDAFCGRIPRSILARHYTDYSAEKLKEIYNAAGIKVGI